MRILIDADGCPVVDITVRIQTGDIVITQDYGLAAMCLARKAVSVSQNGMVYDDSNMDALLFARYTAKKIRKAGGRLKGPAKRTGEQDIQFQNTLTHLIAMSHS